MNFDWDWATAEREFKRAVQLNPNYPTAHHWYAEYLAATGRFDEALAEIDRAQALDPLSLIISSDKGKFLYFARRYAAATAQLRQTLEMEPGFVQARLWLAFALAEQGLQAEAVAQFEQAKSADDRLWGLGGLGYIYGIQGRKDEARRVLAELRQFAGRRRVDPLILVIVYIGLGEKEQAFACLEREYEVRSVGLTGLQVAPVFDSLRPDPRFADLMRRVGFPTA